MVDLAAMKTVIFDTETTDLIKNSLVAEKHQPQIIEFFGVGFEGDGLDLRELEFLCNPGRTLPKKITEITGITDDQLEGTLPFSHYATKVRELIEWADVVVAHNLSYDQAVINTEMKRIGETVKWPDVRICTVESTEHLKGHRLNLGALYELLFERPFEGAHRARADVVALSKCYYELLGRGEI